MSAVENRRANLRLLIQQWDGPGNLAAKLGYTNASFLVQMAGPNPTREVTEKTARSFEKKLDLPAGWLDRPPAKSKPSAAAVDTTLVVDVIRLVGHEVEDSGVVLSPSKFADLVALVYADAAQAGSVRAEFVKQLIQLAR